MTSPTRETVEEAKAKATEFSEAGHRVPARFVQTLLTALQAREEEIESLEQTCSALHSTGEEICGRNTALQSALAEALGAMEPFVDRFGAGIPRPDEFELFSGLTLGDFRHLDEVHSRLTNGEGGGA